MSVLFNSRCVVRKDDLAYCTIRQSVQIKEPYYLPVNIRFFDHRLQFVSASLLLATRSLLTIDCCLLVFVMAE